MGVEKVDLHGQRVSGLRPDETGRKHPFINPEDDAHSKPGKWERRLAVEAENDEGGSTYDWRWDRW